MRLRYFYKKYEHHINTAAFLAGFIFDSLAFAYVDHSVIRWALATWLVVAGVGIVMHASLHREFPRETFFGGILDWVTRILPFIIQFAFGAILSGTLIFFSHSASLSVSWPFLLIIIAFIVGNEAFRSRYSELAFQTISFFIASFFYGTLVVPFILNDIGTVPFLISGVSSIFFVFLLMRLLRRFAYERYEVTKWLSRVGVGVFYIIFNILYFNNLIPPLPLALEEIGIYHSVQRTATGDYSLVYEPGKMLSWSTVSDTYHIGDDKRAHAFTAVYAPEGIQTTIIHRWSFFNETRKEWLVLHTEEFLIIGGRVGGYRGYSTKENMFPGEWRVEVLTQSGKLIGRTMFVVVEETRPVTKETMIR